MDKLARRKRFYSILKYITLYILFILISYYIDGNNFSLLPIPWKSPVATALIVGFFISKIIGLINKEK